MKGIWGKIIIQHSNSDDDELRQEERGEKDDWVDYFVVLYVLAAANHDSRKNDGPKLQANCGQVNDFERFYIIEKFSG